MNKKVILNWGPPASIMSPSPAMSVLKAHLESNGYKTDVIYWNLYLYNIFEKLFGTSITDEKILLILYVYIANEKKDYCLLKRLKIELQANIQNKSYHKPEYLDRLIDSTIKEIDICIDKCLSMFDLSQILYFGFSVNLYQWIFASIIASKLKQSNSKIPIIIGGLSSKDVAFAFLDNFVQFDIAIWGEGEIALNSVTHLLHNKSELNEQNTPANVVFKYNNKIQMSGNTKVMYIDFDKDIVYPNPIDFFIQYRQTKLNNYYSLPIEGSRGCHWKRCRFCYLNHGYRFRHKPISAIKSEIKEQIMRFGVHTFTFLDNDIIGGDIKRFDMLLDEFIDIKKQHPKFNIRNAEIITKDIPLSIIKKMAYVDFSNIQIGYESPSDSLLKKIHKKNTFASNFFFIKFADILKLNIVGINIIANLPEETDDDIYESIDNLDFLRFILSKQRFKHNMIALCINKNSKYYPAIRNDITNWDKQPIGNRLTEGYLKQRNLPYIIEYASKSKSPLWNYFSIKENHYLSQKYDYKLFNLNGDILYKEYCNNILIKEYLFKDKTIDKYILNISNNKIITIQEIINGFAKTYDSPICIEKTKTSITRLHNNRLIYCSEDLSEIISVINLSNIEYI